MGKKFPKIELKPEVAPLVRRGSGWYYRNQLKKLPSLPPGEIVAVELKGREIGLAFYNSKSELPLRLFHWGAPPPTLDQNYWFHRLRWALERRRALPIDSDSFRLVHSEGDLLPGLIIDLYRSWAVVSFNGAGVDRLRREILTGLTRLLPLRGVWEKRDPIRKREGLEVGESHTLWGEVPTGEIVIREGSLRFLVNLREGQKTGFYLDQRENREIIGNLPNISRTLDIFSNGGGFGIAQGVKGGEVTFLDISPLAVGQIEKNCHLNGVKNFQILHGDAFKFLEEVKGRWERGELPNLSYFAQLSSLLNSQGEGEEGEIKPGGKITSEEEITTDREGEGVQKFTYSGKLGENLDDGKGKLEESKDSSGGEGAIVLRKGVEIGVSTSSLSPDNLDFSRTGELNLDEDGKVQINGGENLLHPAEIFTPTGQNSPSQRGVDRGKVGKGGERGETGENLENGEIDPISGVSINFGTFPGKVWRVGKEPLPETLFNPYDLIILDPPPFAKGRRARQGALKGWKFLIANSLYLLKPGGYLALFSCSHAIPAEELIELTLTSATRLNRIVEEIQPLRQAKDHPHLPATPATLYLTGSLLRIW
jgi:23S rRNA (cytosine1962-C5)-methyltransferase